jgi:tetratricopeptide (TPR) repeat protein
MTRSPDAARRPSVDGAMRCSRAEELLELVHSDISAAGAEAAAMLKADSGDEAAAIALRVVSMSLRFSDAATACVKLEESIALSLRLGLPVRAAQARISLVAMLSAAGRTRTALRQAATAETDLQDPEHALDLARLRVNHALVLQRIGRTAEALACFDAAAPVLRQHGDAVWEGVLRSNRGILLAYRGKLDGAIDDLRRGIEICEPAGLDTLLCILHQNLGFALLRSGRIPEALREIARAERSAELVGLQIDSAYADRAETLLAAGLAVEALENAERAVAGQLAADLAFDAAESRLMAARAALAANLVGRAAQLAAQARAEFSRQRRYNWAAQAWQMELAARFAEGERTPELLRELTRCVTRLERAGWLATPQHARLQAARAAAALGRRAQADRLYAQISADRFSGLATLRILAWEAESERRLLRGDRGGAGRAVTQGLKVLAEFAGTLGATDLRAGSAALGTELATTGLRLSLESGSARSLLVRAEQWRAASLRRAPARPAQSGQLAERLSRLRAVTTQVQEGPLKKEGPVDITALQRERVKLEEEIRELARHTPGSPVAPEAPLVLKTLDEALDGRALVEYVRLDDELHAVVLAQGRCTRHRIGSYAAVLKELESLRFVMGRIAKQYGSPAMLLGAQTIYQHARVRLDRMLLDPLRRRIGDDGELVLVPTGSLHALAWAVLPSMEGRVLTVAPSARSWLAAEQVPERPGPVALAHGPGLPHAEDEIAALAKLYPGAKPLQGSDAGADAVAESWDGARLAHLAAHGRFRRDNPLFSNLELADGPLTVYDLESLGRAPRVLILSACDSALSGIHPGDELMGVASALLALGSKTLIASVAPVDDEYTRTLMTALHTGLGRGLRPAVALAEAQAEHPEAPAFICLGAG